MGTKLKTPISRQSHDMAAKPQLSNRRHWLLAAAIIIATVAAYLPSMHGQFVMDDLVNIQDNRLLRDAAGLARIWIPGQTQQYYPITYTTHWLEYRLWGPDPTGYHVVNTLLHALNALLIARLMTRLGVPAPWLIAAVFALHPIQVESVAYITERKNLLSAMFYLLSALAYLRFDSAPSAPAGKTPKWRWYALSMGLFALALLSKTVAVSLPIALALAHLYRFGSLPLRSLPPLIPMLLLGGALALVTARVEHTTVGAVGPDFEFSSAQRLIIASRALLFYPSKLLWPSELMFIYPRWTINAESIAAWWPVAAVGALGALAVAAWIRGWRKPVIALAYYIVTIFPALGFVTYYYMRYSFVADHHAYLAVLGVIALVTGGAAQLVPPSRLARWLAILAPATLGAATWIHASAYRDALTLWTLTLESNPDSLVVRHNLAVELSRLAVLDIARSDFKQAAERLGMAEAHWREALRRNPEYHEGHAALGDLLFRKQHYEEALEQYRLGLAAVRRIEDDLRARSASHRENPPSAQYLLRIAHVFEQLGRDEEAEQAMREAVAIAPNRVEGRYALAAQLARRGMAAEAAAQIAQLLKIDPQNVDTLILLGDISHQAKDDTTAIMHYRAAVRAAVDPVRRSTATVKLIYLLATSSDDKARNGMEALSLAEQLIATSGGDAMSLQALAAAQAEMRLFPEAVKTAGQAKRRAEDAGLFELAESLAAQMASYEAQRPWRE